MGISDLRDIAKLSKQPLDHFSGKSVAVDAYQYLYCYSTVVVRYRNEEIYTSDDGKNLSNIIGLLKGLPTLLKNDIDPIFVFDGTADKLKEDTIQSRKEKKKEAETKMKEAIERGNTKDARKYKARTHRITPATIETSKRLLDNLGIPNTTAPGDGEKFASTLVSEGKVDAVLTDDYDALLFGSSTTIRQYSGSGKAEKMKLDETLSHHEITHSQLVDIAILMGTDFNDGVYGIGPKTAVKRVKQYGDIHTVLAETDATVENVDQIRSIFLEQDTPQLPTDDELTQTERNHEEAVNYATDLGLPEDEIRSKVNRI